MGGEPEAGVVRRPLADVGCPHCGKPFTGTNGEVNPPAGIPYIVIGHRCRNRRCREWVTLRVALPHGVLEAYLRTITQTDR